MGDTTIEYTIDDSLHDAYRVAREAGPGAIDGRTGAVVALEYSEVERLSHDPRLAGIGLTLFDMLGIGDGPLRTWYSSIMFTLDGDAHHRLRRLAAKAFTPRSVERHRSLAASLTADRMEAIVSAREGDLIASFRDLPITVICTLIGVPDDQISDFVAYAEALSPVFGFMNPDQIAAAQAAVVGLSEGVDRMIESRRDRRGEDLISALLDAEDAGDRLTHDEVITMVGNLIVGGDDTTASQIGCSLLTLLRYPEALDDLRADPAIASAVVNETIRYEPSITLVPRTVIEPIEVGNAERSVGSLVLLSSASTSRQDDVWGDPEVFRPARFSEPGSPKLLSFGSGPHYCLGAALARMTLEEVVVGAAAAGLGDSIVPTTDVTAGAVDWVSTLGRSPASLPVTVC